MTVSAPVGLTACILLKICVHWQLKTKSQTINLNTLEFQQCGDSLTGSVAANLCGQMIKCNFQAPPMAIEMSSHGCPYVSNMQAYTAIE